MKGVVVSLSAIALSIKPGGSAREIEINGIKTNGHGVPPIEQHCAIASRVLPEASLLQAASTKSE